MKDINYDIRILDSPMEMRELILEKNHISHNKARILAGYCWDWKKEGVNDSAVYDIKIGDFEISWNLKIQQLLQSMKILFMKLDAYILLRDWNLTMWELLLGMICGMKMEQ